MITKSAGESGDRTAYLSALFITGLSEPHFKWTIPSSVEVYYKVDDVVVAVAHYAAQGCQILVAPFDITIGKCAVIRDPFGTRLCILDTTKGLRPSNLAEPPNIC